MAAFLSWWQVEYLGLERLVNLSMYESVTRDCG